MLCESHSVLLIEGIEFHVPQAVAGEGVEQPGRGDREDLGRLEHKVGVLHRKSVQLLVEEHNSYFVVAKVLGLAHNFGPVLGRQLDHFVQTY